MKILFHPIESWGHMNATIGVAQIMLKCGHQIIFAVTENVRGQFRKHGFQEIILKTEPITPPPPLDRQTDCVDFLMNSTDVFWEKEPLKKYSMFQKVFEIRVEEILQTEQQMKEILHDEKPDLILVDQILISPIIIRSGIPWVLIFSCNPISFHNDQRLPPPFSGLPIDDQSLWSKYRQEFKQTYHHYVISNQNFLMKHYGYEPLTYDGISPPSPYLNIYGFPEELDYNNIAPMPNNCFRIDTFCRSENEELNISKEFLHNHRDNKLIYISLGTLASIRFDLIKKILMILSQTKYGFIVSKGRFDDGFKLPDNMFGAKHLPQTKVLPLVDLVITHGGNNTVTESLLFGKPMIVMPFFADQYDNAQRLQENGYGARLDPFNYRQEDLINLVERLLNDQQLKQRLMIISKRMQTSNLRDELAKRLERLVEMKN
ncbi:NDP-glycosyltransferase YjiC [Dermatophagoides farinae]|uniref:NDP-glycosyltransferase YjiC n=1 Tax=Dermatophagoides farinae TaxID=6954 RepID=UPI003F5FD05D